VLLICGLLIFWAFAMVIAVGLCAAARYGDRDLALVGPDMGDGGSEPAYALRAAG
jgi:hypothetical protein